MHAPVAGLRAFSNTRLAAPALAIVVAGIATVATVWALQHAGYAPCELCFKERLPFYWGIPLAAVVALLAFRGRVSLLPAGYAALGIVFLSGVGLGIYHTGVEWHLWAGPTACTGDIAAPAGVDDFLKQLQTTQVVRCDAPALQVAGLSLAAWNALLCFGLTALATFGFVSAERAHS